MTYPTTIPQNYTALLEYDNTVTNGLFSPVLLLSIFTTAFMVLYGRGNENALMAASVLTTISAFMLYGVGVMPIIWVFASVVMTLVSIYALPKPKG